MLQKVVICGVDTAGLPKLTAEENDRLMKALKAGDMAAREQFIVGNMRLVLSLVKRFWAKNANADDVFQAGCVGLIKAIDHFDMKFNVKFSTYAVPSTLGRRNARKGAFMTRKRALLEAISRLEGQNEARAEVVVRLREVIELMPFVKWTERMARDCVEQFIADHGRAPIVTELIKKNGMPTNNIFPYLCGMTAGEWLIKNFPPDHRPGVTIRQAIGVAIDVVGEGEAAEKLKETLEEYPLTKWNVKNICDGLETFFEERGHLPREEDYRREAYLPFVDIFRYQYGMRRNDWIERYCPALMRMERARGRAHKASALEAFAREYERVRPLTRDDFDRKRDEKKVCTAAFIMRKNHIRGWGELLSVCGLERVVKSSPQLITKVSVVVF